MKPRVLLVSQEVHPIPPLKGAAVEQWIDTVASRLTGFEAHVVSVPHPYLPNDQVCGAVHYHRIHVGAVYKRFFKKLTRLDPYPYAARIADYARRIGAAIIHVHNAPQYIDVLSRRASGAKLLLHMHNEKDLIPGSKVRLFAGCSQYIVDWFRDRRMKADDFVVIPNGVDAIRFSPTAGERSREVRARFHIPEDRAVVLYVGRISPEKGPEFLVEAFRVLDQKRFHLVLVGEWPSRDVLSSERAAFAERLRVSLSGLSVTVIDVVPPNEMPEMYRLGDILVIPSRFEEPFSMVAIESMASGVPVIALNKGGMREYLRDEDNARVLPAHSQPSDMAAAIQGMFADPEFCGRITRRAQQLVTDRFSWERVAAETEETYRRMLGI